MNEVIEKLEKIKLGISEEDVLQILPEPDSIFRFLELEKSTGAFVKKVIWCWGFVDVTAQVSYRMGKVVSVVSAEKTSSLAKKDVFMADSPISFKSVFGSWFDAGAQKWVQEGRFASLDEARAAMFREVKVEANSDDISRIEGGGRVNLAAAPTEDTDGTFEEKRMFDDAMIHILSGSPKGMSSVFQLIDLGLKERFAVRFRREAARLKREQAGIDLVRRSILGE